MSLNNLYFVGQSGVLLRSNSLNHSSFSKAQNITTSEDLNGVQYFKDGVVYFVGQNGVHGRSTDAGYSFSLGSTFPADIKDLAFGNNTAVMVGGNPTLMKYSNDLGGTWQDSISPFTGSAIVWSIDYGNGLFMAIAADPGASSGFMSTSRDGINWTTKTALSFLSATPAVSRVRYFNDRWFITRYSNSFSFSENNGSTWSTGGGTPSGTLTDIDFGLNVYAFVGTNNFVGTIKKLGDVSTQTISNISPDIANVIKFNGIDKFIASSSLSQIMLESTDGLNWTQVSNPLKSSSVMLDVNLQSEQPPLFSSQITKNQKFLNTKVLFSLDSRIQRITEAGDTRITEAGDTRVTESSTDSIINTFSKRRISGDIVESLGKVTQAGSKIDIEQRFSFISSASFEILGFDNYKNIINGNVIRGKQVNITQQIIDGQGTETDLPTFVGFVNEYDISNEKIKFKCKDFVGLETKIPQDSSVSSNRTVEIIDYSNTNVVDILTNILTGSGNGRLNIDSTLVNSASFTQEKDSWLSNYSLERIMTKSEDVTEVLNDLMAISDSYLVQNGAQIFLKTFMPRSPFETAIDIKENDDILIKTFKQSSNFEESFINTAIILYDYDESGGDDDSNYSSISIAFDQDSLTENGTKIKKIRTKWLKSYTFTSTPAVTGLTVFHISRDAGDLSIANPGLNNILTFNSTTKVITFQAAGDGSAGSGVEILKEGEFQINSVNTQNFVRIFVDDFSSFSASDFTVNINVTTLNASIIASAIATRIVNRFKDSLPLFSFDLSLNSAIVGSNLLKPSDFINLTHSRAVTKQSIGLTDEEMMITEVTPNFDKGVVGIKCIETTLGNKYGFISPSSHTNDWGVATDEEKEFAFIGDDANLLDGEPGFLIS